MHTPDNTSPSEKLNGHFTPGDSLSNWFVSEIKPDTVKEASIDIDSDNLVTGRGIVGLHSAHCLAKEGLKGILLEDSFIRSGESRRNTEHLTCGSDEHYCALEKTFDKLLAKLAMESRTAAIEWIENTIKENNNKLNYPLENQAK